MKRLLILGLSLFLTTAYPAFGASSKMTQEEAVVRTSYAKLVYATQLNAVHETLKKSKTTVADVDARLAAISLKIEISSLKSGAINEILQRHFSDLVTKPEGQDVLAVGTALWVQTDDLPEKRDVKETKEVVATTPQWMSGEVVGENWNVPEEHFLRIAEAQNQSTYSRYAAYQVAVTFQGKSRSYNAMFLFGQGKVPILVLDNVIVGGGLPYFANNPLYPTTLLDSSLTQRPAVADWLKAHQVVEGECKGGQRNVCCNPDTLQCGIAAEDVQNAFTKSVSQLLTPQAIYRPGGLTSLPPGSLSARRSSPSGRTD